MCGQLDTCFNVVPVMLEHNWNHSSSGALGKVSQTEAEVVAVVRTIGLY